MDEKEKQIIKEIAKSTTISPFASLAPDGRTVFWHQKGGRVRTPEEAQATAERKRRKEEKALPLLAPIIEQVSTRLKTPDEIIDADLHQCDKLAAYELMSYYRALELRAMVGEIVSVEDLAKLDDERFGIYPADVTYSWGFWFKKIKELRPEAAWEICLNRERHEMFSRWHEECPACGAPLRKKE